VELAKLYNPKKITLCDGAVRRFGRNAEGADAGFAGFFARVDAIAHVIRVFDDPSVAHAEGTVDPLRDATNLELELILFRSRAD